MSTAIPTAPSTPLERLTQPRIFRRVIYLAGSFASLIAAIYGFDAASQQIDAFTASAGFSTVVNLVAAWFTKKGADSTATDSELYAERQRAASLPDAATLADEVRRRVAPDLAKLTTALSGGTGGRHAAAAKQPVGATYPGSEDA